MVLHRSVHIPVRIFYLVAAALVAVLTVVAAALGDLDFVAWSLGGSFAGFVLAAWEAS